MEFTRERVADPTRGAAVGSLAEGGGKGEEGDGEGTARYPVMRMDLRRLDMLAREGWREVCLG